MHSLPLSRCSYSRIRALVTTLLILVGISIVVNPPCSGHQTTPHYAMAIKHACTASRDASSLVSHTIYMAGFSSTTHSPFSKLLPFLSSYFFFLLSSSKPPQTPSLPSIPLHTTQQNLTEPTKDPPQCRHATPPEDESNDGSEPSTANPRPEHPQRRLGVLGRYFFSRSLSKAAPQRLYETPVPGEGPPELAAVAAYGRGCFWGRYVW